ncbi:MAG: hypothetical protein AAGA55_10250 [Planctomycetota bacterium]
MLKFIRKYQLIILAIGGSLLMVVFLLEPVITSFQRSQNNRTVARYADGTKVGALERERASAELELAKRIAPMVFAPRAQGGLGLAADDSDGVDPVLHWLMLSRLTEEAGLVGGVDDGGRLVEISAELTARQFLQQNMMQVLQGAITQEELFGQAEQITSIMRTNADREVQAVAGVIRGATPDDIWRSLAKFQGAYRLNQLYVGSPAFSPGGARAGIGEINDAVAMDAALIPGSMLAHTVSDPTEAELDMFFQERAGLQPAEDAFGIGYAQPARVQLAWLQLDRSRFIAAVPIDRVELRKIWELDSQRPESERIYPGDFASERSNIEVQYRSERADRLMVEADQIIRARVLGVTRQLEREGDRLVLPEDWQARRPSFSEIADAIVTEFAARDLTMPTPTIEQLDSTWLRSSDIGQLPTIGRSFFRAGSRVTLVSQLPELIGENGRVDAVGMQVGVPQVDPAAQDEAGNRYYLLITDFMPAGPSQSIDDAGRDRVIADYKSLRGYEQLATLENVLRDAAASPDGVTSAVDMAAGGVLPDGVRRPGVYPNILVSRLRIESGALARNVDQRLNVPAFREAAAAILKDIDPLSDPEVFQSNPVAISVPLPETRSMAVARVVAPRPLTREDFRSRIRQSLSSLGGLTLRDAIDSTEGIDPFSYEGLNARFGLVPVGRDAEDQP